MFSHRVTERHNEALVPNQPSLSMTTDRKPTSHSKLINGPIWQVAFFSSVEDLRCRLSLTLVDFAITISWAATAGARVSGERLLLATGLQL